MSMVLCPESSCLCQCRPSTSQNAASEHSLQSGHEECFLVLLQEAEQVMDTFNNHLHLPVTKVDDSERVLAALQVSVVSLLLQTYTHHIVSRAQGPAHVRHKWPFANQSLAIEGKPERASQKGLALPYCGTRSL